MYNKQNRIINMASPIAPIRNLRPYNIAENGDDTEITMYGEVVESQPIDWWTGEPVPGLYIILADFLNDLNNIKSKNSITVRVNSVGGDLFAGISIYNRLKELDNVITIVDGLAASAASIIAQAGSVRKVYESSQVMAHGASVGLFDYYNVQQLYDVIEQVKAANDAVINVYAERTGITQTKLRHMVESTTWMTGQEIINQGFADEVISGKKVTMNMSSDKSLFYCNGVPMNAKRLTNIPKNVTILPQAKVQTAKDADDINNKNGKGEVIMDINELRANHPDLVQQIENAARQTTTNDAASAIASATAAERTRIKNIESIEASIADKKLVEEAKYGDSPMDAKDLAFIAMQKQAQLGNKFLDDNKEDVKNSGADGVQADLNSGMDDGKEKKDEAADIAIAVNAYKSSKGVK